MFPQVATKNASLTDAYLHCCPLILFQVLLKDSQSINKQNTKYFLTSWISWVILNLLNSFYIYKWFPAESSVPWMDKKFASRTLKMILFKFFFIHKWNEILANNFDDMSKVIDWQLIVGWGTKGISNFSILN